MNVERYYKKAYLDLPSDESERKIEIEKFEKVVKMANKLLDVDTSEMETYEITSELISPLRDDEIKESTDRELIFANTQHREYGYFKLDNIMED